MDKQKTNVTIYLDSELAHKLRIQAAEKNISRTRFIENVLSDYLKTQEGNKKNEQ